MDTRTQRVSGRLALLAGVSVVVACAVAQEAVKPPTGAPPAEAKAPEKPATGEKGKEGEKPPEKAPEKARVDPFVLDFTMKRLDGTDQNLREFLGKVVLIVNVASKCGYTPQYEGLEKLYRLKKESGLVVLGFPANNFRNQEPGTDAEIAKFCKERYDVTFPMFAKISVAGSDAHPLYKKLSSQPKPIGGEVDWNFNKFLVDRNGNVVARFGKHVKPDDAGLVKAIDDALAQKPTEAKAGK